MDVIEKFITATSKTQIFDLLVDQCRDLGFDYCVYSPLLGGQRSDRVFKDESRIMEHETLIAHNTFINCPTSWLHRYQAEKHVEKDPVIKHVSTSLLPIFWHDAKQSDPRNIVLNEASDHGLSHGVTASVYGHGGQRALLSFSTDKEQKESSAQKMMTASLVQLTAHYVHEAVQTIAGNLHQGSLPALSTREKDCLQWAAIGKTSWEIAQILKISERTVVFHLTNATRKLHATNRRQAVVRALSLRLINP